MYILKWTYRNTIPEYNNLPGELMQHLEENARTAYRNRRDDTRYEGLKVYLFQNGKWIDVTARFNRD